MKKMSTLSKAVLGLCTGLLLAAQSSAAETVTKGQVKKHYELAHLDAEINVDGELTESFWKNATRMNIAYDVNPGDSTPAPVKTDVYLAENGQSLLLAFVAYDPNIKKLRATLSDRDSAFQDDFIGIMIDSFNDELKAFEFLANPLGVQMDGIKDDINGNEDFSWNSIWKSEGKVYEDRYVVEMEIPFKVLRFSDSKDTKTWGIALIRNYPRELRHQLFSNKLERKINCFLCQFDKVSGLKNIESGNNMELVPFVTMQKSERRQLPNNPNWMSDGVEHDVGVDFRWGVTDNSVLNLTVNPDFSQVESDSIQLEVNNNFSLYYSEKRPFFLEGADYFSTNFNILHTRNIANPDIGAKYTGKTGKHSYAALLARDEVTSFILPRAQSSSSISLYDGTNPLESDVGVLRYSYDLGKSSRIGAIYTERSADGYSNRVFGTDGKYYITDADTVNFQFLKSRSVNPQQVIDRGYADEQSGSAYSFLYSHKVKDWGMYITRNFVGKDFRADLGFMNQAGYRKDIIGANYQWYFDDKDSFFNRVNFSTDYDKTHRHDGQKLEEEFEFRVSANGLYQSWIGLGSGVRDAYYTNGVSSDVDGPWFRQNFWWLSANYKPLSNLQIGINPSASDAIFYARAEKAKNSSFNVWADWQVLDNWNLNANYSYRALKNAADYLYKTNSYSLRTSYQFNKESYLRFIYQLTKVDFNRANYNFSHDNSDRKAMQLLYAYKWNSKTTFYLGYSDNERSQFNENPHTLAQQDLSQTEGRTLFSKFTYAWQL